MFGRLLADIALGNQNTDRALFVRNLLPLPPEALRWMFFNGLSAYYGMKDARTDRILRHEQGA